MANREELKRKFLNGNCPNEKDYASLFDSFINIEDDKIIPSIDPDQLTIKSEVIVEEKLKAQNFVLLNDSIRLAIQKILSQTEGEGFGKSIASSNDGILLAIGAPDFQNKKGKVYLFERDEYITKTWLLRKVWEGKNRDGKFGYSVAISDNGNLLAVGEPGNKKVYIYNLKKDFKKTVIPHENEKIGYNLGFNESNKLAISSPGAIFIYDCSYKTLDEVINKTDEGDIWGNFGIELAINQSGDMIITTTFLPYGNGPRPRMKCLYLYFFLDDHWVEKKVFEKAPIIGSKVRDGDFMFSLGKKSNTIYIRDNENYFYEYIRDCFDFTLNNSLQNNFYFPESIMISPEENIVLMATQQLLFIENPNLIFIFSTEDFFPAISSFESFFSLAKEIIPIPHANNNIVLNKNGDLLFISNRDNSLTPINRFSHLSLWDILLIINRILL
jgi:WD40 repeat protein